MPFVKLGQSPLSNVNFSCNQFNVSVLGSQGGGGGEGRGYSGFQVTGMMKWGQNQNPKKSVVQKLTPPPPKFHAKFPNLKISSKTNLVILHLQNYVARGYAGATTNVQIVPYPKISQNGRFQTQKNPLIIPMT